MCNAQTHSLNKGLQRFKDKGKIAVIKEIFQLHNRDVFTPILPTEVTDKEKYKAINSLIFITEKRVGSVKARACANGSVQTKYITKEDKFNCNDGRSINNMLHRREARKRHHNP